ncbi:hypothetical protein LCGC14_2827530 [marine sediment metagenome]|uniref:Uncharacterized protein n=1 Tax=marine sediment metagenome TaxID=412755 RepID=A0A0F9ANJ8_9ZZZZ
MTEKDVRLAELRQSISDMSDQELAELLDITRNNRRAPPEKTKKKASPRKQAETMTKATSSLSQAQAKALLAKLLPKNDGSEEG